jgi:hypothetical protein
MTKDEKICNAILDTLAKKEWEMINEVFPSPHSESEKWEDLSLEDKEEIYNFLRARLLITIPIIREQILNEDK